ncbi:flagellar biosynthetic protein FliP, partial [Pseudomonas mohnii]|nr:flagellar biosynthetic protein FliP [Pseudomonas mohnii]
MSAPFFVRRGLKRTLSAVLLFACLTDAQAEPAIQGLAAFTGQAG